jgi:DNA mismatch repair ATPase MutL
LSSICSIAKVCITTRTSSDLQAKKFVLNNKSEIVSETVTAGNIGTIVIVENIFENFPVRKRLLQQKSKSSAVSSMDQALTTVIGHPISKNLVKCRGSIIVPNDEAPRQIDAFFLKKPIDMRTMSFTSNKLTFIFVNRKRVFIREFEKVSRIVCNIQ